jgi:hypothetical protein
MIRQCLSIFLAASSTSGVSFAAADSFPSKQSKLSSPSRWEEPPTRLRGCLPT